MCSGDHRALVGQDAMVKKALPELLCHVRAQIKQMTDRDLARLWSQYVKELAVLLVLAEGPHPPPEVVERMQELVQRELLLLYIRYGNCHLQPLGVSSRLNVHVKTWTACLCQCCAQKSRGAAENTVRLEACRKPSSPGAFLASVEVDGVCNVNMPMCFELNPSTAMMNRQVVTQWSARGTGRR